MLNEVVSIVHHTPRANSIKFELQNFKLPHHLMMVHILPHILLQSIRNVSRSISIANNACVTETVVEFRTLTKGFAFYHAERCVKGLNDIEKREQKLFAWTEQSIIRI